MNTGPSLSNSSRTTANTPSPQVLARHPERGATAVRCEPKGEQPETDPPPRSAATTGAKAQAPMLNEGTWLFAFVLPNV